MQWACQLVVKTGTPPDGGVDGPSPGGGVNLFQGEFSTLRGCRINPCEERCKLPNGAGTEPLKKSNWLQVSLKIHMTADGNNFNDVPEN